MAPSSASAAWPSTSGCRRQLLADRRAQGAGASAVNDPDLMRGRRGPPRRRGGAPALAPPARQAANVQLIRHVAARRGAHLDGRRPVLGHALAGRAKPGERDAHALPCRTDHLGIVAANRGDRAAHADVGRLDRVALGERAARRQGPAEIAQRPLGAVRALGRRAEQAVLLGLALPPPREPQVLAQRAQLGARLGQLALGLRHGLQPCALGRCLNPFVLPLELASRARARPSASPSSAAEQDRCPLCCLRVWRAARRCADARA